MNTIFKAIKARFDSAAGADLKAALTGGLWLHEAPQNARAPYGVITRVSLGNADTFTERIGDDFLQFDLYATSAASVVSLADAALALFDGQEVSATGMLPAVLTRENVYGPMRDGFENQDPWRVTIEFAALVENDS